jgi:hypothetical protein
MSSFCGIPTKPTSGLEREYLGDWVGLLVIDDDEYHVRPDGAGGALLNASGCLQIDWYDDGRRALHADASGVVHGVAGRVGQIVEGAYVARPDWTAQDLGIDERARDR